VPLLYQSYRPAWAGREAELAYQLHSTPAQVWAELGGLGIGLGLMLLGWLGYWGIRLWRGLLPQALAGEAVSSIEYLTASTRRSQSTELECDRIFTWSLLAGLGGYGIVALTDYQLDIVCISGTLIIYLASLLSLLRQYAPSSSEQSTLKLAPKSIKVVYWGLVGILLAVGLWLAPIHRAWQLSSQGFAALAEEQFDAFRTDLEQAHRLAPWEPYYTYQLGWNLSQVSSDDAQVKQANAKQSLEYFEHNVQASPNQESGTSSLGWQQLFNGQFPQAANSFLKSTRLMPAKGGVFYSLGQSLLLQNKKELGVKAIALEIVRDPLFLTSPLLQTPQMAPIYPQVQAEVVRLYQQLLENRSEQDPLTPYLHQILGGVYWWQGNLDAATAQWQQEGQPLGEAILAIAKNKAISTDVPILKAWLEPQQRTQWIEKALLQANQSPPNPQEVQAIQTGMDRSQSFDQWVKQNAPVRQSPRVRAGFGVLSRHIDGPAPADFFPVVENAVVAEFLPGLFPSPFYSPALDTALQPFRERLWRSISL
ncbi:MAG: O-antigen ligase domain-containing protein, partial [Thermosynechococcaceae cyanobacterium]